MIGEEKRRERKKRQAKYSNAATNRPTTAVMKHNFSGFLLLVKQQNHANRDKHEPISHDKKET